MRMKQIAFVGIVLAAGPISGITASAQQVTPAPGAIMTAPVPPATEIDGMTVRSIQTPTTRVRIDDTQEKVWLVEDLAGNIIGQFNETGRNRDRIYLRNNVLNIRLNFDLERKMVLYSVGGAPLTDVDTIVSHEGEPEATPPVRNDPAPPPKVNLSASNGGITVTRKDGSTVSMELATGQGRAAIKRVVEYEDGEIRTVFSNVMRYQPEIENPYGENADFERIAASLLADIEELSSFEARQAYEVSEVACNCATTPKEKVLLRLRVLTMMGVG